MHGGASSRERRTTLEIHLNAKLRQPTLENLRWGQPDQAVGRVQRQNRARVEHIENVDRSLYPAPLHPEDLAEADIDLCHTVAEHAIGGDELRRRGPQPERATEVLDLRARHGIPRADRRTGSIL